MSVHGHIGHYLLTQLILSMVTMNVCPWTGHSGHYLLTQLTLSMVTMNVCPRIQWTFSIDSVDIVGGHTGCLSMNCPLPQDDCLWIELTLSMVTFDVCP